MAVLAAKTAAAKMIPPAKASLAERTGGDLPALPVEAQRSVGPIPPSLTTPASALQAAIVLRRV